MVEWKSAEMNSGVLYVTIHGTIQMPVSPADSWDSPDTVCYARYDKNLLIAIIVQQIPSLVPMPSMVRAVDLSTSMILDALVVNKG